MSKLELLKAMIESTTVYSIGQIGIEWNENSPYQRIWSTNSENGCFFQHELLTDLEGFGFSCFLSYNKEKERVEAVISIM